MIELLAGMSNKDYHALPQWSRSQLVDYIESPELFFGRYVSQEIERKQATPAMDFGILVDEFLTEGKLPDPEIPRDVAIIPQGVLSKSGSRAGKTYKDWMAENVKPDQESKTPKQCQEYREIQGRKASVCMRIQEQIGRHRLAANLLLQGERIFQGSLVDGVMRSRPDLIRPGHCIVDVKTSASVHEEHFARQSLSFGYDIQAAMASDLWYVLKAEMLTVVFVVIHNEPPYEIATYEFDSAFMDYGRQRYQQAVKGITSRRFLPDGHGEGKVVHLPRWTKEIT